MKTKLFIFPIVVLFVSLIFLGIGFAENINAKTDVNQPNISKTDTGGSGAAGSAFLAAALSTGLGAIGAGIAVGYVGAAAMGAVAERPELTGKALIFLGLAEGIAIYGLIISIMILAKA